MNAQITYSVRRNVKAKDKNGRPCKIAMALVLMPDGKTQILAIPEGLLDTIPPDKRDDFIAHEVEIAVGYEVTRVH